MPVDFNAYAQALLNAQPSTGRRPRARLSPPVFRPPAPPPEPEQGTLSKLATGAGDVLGWAKNKVDIAANYYSNDFLRNRVLRGEDPIPTGTLLKEGLIAPPEPGMSKHEQYLRSIGRGATEAIGNIVTDPVTVSLLGGAAGLAPKALQAPMHLGFAGMMAHGMYEGGKEAYTQFRADGFTPSVAEELAKVGVDAALIGGPFAAKAMRGRGRGAAQETGFELMPDPTGPVRGVRPGIPRRPKPETGFELMPDAGSALARTGTQAVGGVRMRRPPSPPIDATVLPPPELPPSTGRGLPEPGRSSSANLSRAPEALNIEAHRSFLVEVDNRLRRAIGEGDQHTATQLIKLREAIRESAWQSQPGSAAELRAPYDKPGVSIEVVQQAENRPRMLQVRQGLEQMLQTEGNPIQRAKIRAAVASLDAQLRQNPLPRPPEPQLLPSGPQKPPGAPGEPPPAPRLPEGSGVLPAEPGPSGGPVPGPPGMAPPPPGVAPEMRMPSSAARIGGEGMGPVGALPDRAGAPVDVGQRTAALTEAAQQRAVGLPGEVPLPVGGAPMPVTVEGPSRGTASRAAEPIRAVEASGQGLVPGFVEAAQGTPQMTEGNLPGGMFTAEAARVRAREGPAPAEPVQAEIAPEGQLKRAGFMGYGEGMPTEGLGEMPYVPKGRKISEWNRLKDQVRAAEESGEGIKEAAARIAQGYPEEVRLNIERQVDMLMQNRDVGREYLETLRQRDAMRQEAGEKPSEVFRDENTGAEVELWGKPKDGDYIFRGEGQVAAGARVSRGEYDFVVGGERIMDLPAEGSGAVYRVTKAQGIRSTAGVTPAGLSAQQRALERGLDVRGGMADLVRGGERGGLGEGPPDVSRGPVREAVPEGEPGAGAPPAPRGEARKVPGRAPGAERQPARSKLDARLKREGAERDRVLNLLGDAPRGRVTSGWLVEQGLKKPFAVKMIQALEKEGALEWVRSKKDYRITKKGREAITQVLERPKAPPEPSAPPRALGPQHLESMLKQSGGKVTGDIRSRYTLPLGVKTVTQARAYVAQNFPSRPAPAPPAKRPTVPARMRRAAKAFEGELAGKPAPRPKKKAPKAPRPAKKTAPRLAATKKSWVDRETTLAMEGVQQSIRLVDEAGNLKTFRQGEETKRGGYEQRDIIEDHITGIEIDPNAEYVFNKSSLKGLRAKVRDRIEREYDTMQAELGEPFVPKRITAKVLQGQGLEAGSFGEGPYYSIGPLIVAGKAPRGVTKTRKMDLATGERIAKARQGSRERATLDFVEGETARFSLADGTEIAIPAAHYGHVTKAAGKVGVTWFGKQGQLVAYKGALESPGKKPFAVVEGLSDIGAGIPKGVKLDAVPKGGKELTDFETAAETRVADARAGERGAVSLDLLTAPAMVVRDAIVLGARAMRSGLTKFGPWASAMGRVLGKGVKGLKDLFRWARSHLGAGRRSPSDQVIPPGQKGGGVTAGSIPYDVPAAEPLPTKRGSAAGIGKTGKVVRPGVRDVKAAMEWEGPLRRGDKPKSGFPINTDRITTVEHMREMQHRMAEGMKARLNQNRKHVSWKSAEKTALKAGLSKRQFEALVRERGSVTDAEMHSGRQLREDYAKKYEEKHREWEKLVESGKARPEAIAIAEEAKLMAAAEWGSITAHTTAAGNEVARALSIMRKFSEALSPEERLYQQAMKFGLRKGVDPKLMDALADAVLSKDHAKIAELGTKIMKPTMIDKINEFFINNILSAPATPAANVLGNWGHENLLRTPERGIAGLIEGYVAKKQGRAPERLPQEAFEAMKANWQMGFGFSKQFSKNLRDIFIENPWDPETTLKGEFRPPSLPGKFGKVWRTPSRALRVLDKAARSAAYEAEIAGQIIRESYNTGMAQGKTGDALKAFMTMKGGELTKGIQRWREIDVIRRINGEKALDAGMKDIWSSETLNRIGTAGEKAARESTFQDMPGAFARAALHLRNTHPWLTLFVPFIATPSRILTRAVERTPFGLARAAKRAIKGETKGGKAADELARGIWGTMISAGLYGLAESGLLTGSGPTDPRERSVWRRAGHEPYAVKIGDTWVSMARLEPLATVLGLVADLSEAKNAKKAGDIMDKLVATMTNNVFSKTYLDGIASLIEAVSDPERFGSTYAKKFLGSVTVPNIIATLARATDPYVRETGPMEGLPSGVNLVVPTIMSRIPGVSRTLPARVTGTGEPIEREEAAVSRLLSPIRYRREKPGKEGDLERMMLDVGYIPSRPPKSVTVPGTGGKKIELSQKEKDVYARHMREATKVARKLASDRRFRRLDPLLQEKELKKLWRTARDRAFRYVGPSVVRRFREAR